ncbi:T9SS type A sorting domain-containing protein [Flavobacterium sp. N502540]|uniref:T9SS type A sorting domain-containing protein n=1 Tax=Flavobacterium sp. N502540 TaxID=2986838 RepID=UPI002224F0FA|nr:T9SS type A sorting domain-containing protein [Flavobacterium sp. N502540]
MRSTLLCIFFLINVQFAFCQWVNLNTGLSDDLTGVVFLGNNGFVSGKKGLYYTSNGGEGASSWKRFEITDGSEDANIYNNTAFSHCYSDMTGSASSGVVFACGQNVLTKQAIIMKIELPSLSYQIIYKGVENSNLNQIGYSSYSGSYSAVGDNGLMVTFKAQGVVRTKNLGTDNFSSVAFYQNKCKIAATGKILYFEYFDSKYNFISVLTPGSDIKAITYGESAMNNGLTFCAGNRFAAYSNDNSLYSNHVNFYDGPLNAKCISANSLGEYVGTDHGVYFVASGKALEKQSTSLNYDINCFWKQMANTTFYACGNSGIILKTTNGGGTRVPYVNVSGLEGGCVGSTVALKPIVGWITSCKWFVNNVEVRSVCGDLTYNFEKAGNYEIKYTVRNSFGVESTDSKSIYVSPIPKINLPVIVNDKILCKSEPVTIQIQNSEIDVVYTLKKDFLKYGTSEVGNGQTLTFTSNLISESGDFYLEAKNVNANCTVSLTDRFHIEVEQTKAVFHKDLINALPNEKVSFYQKSIDAQHYKWNFSSNASTNNSIDEKVETAYSKQGATITNLEVWSDNGCHDQIEGEGPYIYNESENSNNCWTLVNNGVDSQWNGHEYEGNYGLTPTDDGFLVSGGFNDQIFDSKIGLKSDFKNKIGSFLTKYDRKGALKWIVSTEHNPVNRDRDIIFSSVIDHDGNIYICGTHNGTFIDNKGDRIKAIPFDSNQNYGYIMKLNKQGKLIWILNAEISGPLAKKLYIDKENNLVTTISLNYIYSNKHQLYFNGIKSTVINQTMQTSQADNLTLLKISPLGAVMWYAGITLNYVNNAGIVDLGFDSSNNIYLGGNYEFDSNFYSAGNTTTPQILKRFEGYGPRMFLVKYNKDGILQWKTRSSTVNGRGNNVLFGAMITDDAGSNYITGSNSCDNEKAVHSFENANGTITQKSIGTFFVAKVNSAGTCEWINGNKYGSSGGRKIIKDNDKLHIIGGGSATSASASTSTFITSDLQNYDLTISEYDFFLATYDLSGNLKKITANGDNRNHATVPLIHMYDFFKAADGTFYLCANMKVNNYTSFGSIISTNGVDGIVSHFDENCGIVKYESTLSTDDFTKTSNTTIYPNPTSGKIYIDLKNYSSDVTVQLYDSNGKKLKEEQASNLTKLDLTINGSQGLYFVKVKAGESIQTFKVLKN